VHLKNDLKIKEFQLIDLTAAQFVYQPVSKKSIFAASELFKELNTEDKLVPNEESNFNLQNLNGICNKSQQDAIQCALENKIGLIQGILFADLGKIILKVFSNQIKII
jgi:hypothetical protein